MCMVTPKPDVDKHKYAENVEEQIIQLTDVKTSPSVLNAIVITLLGTGNVKLNKQKDQGSEKKYDEEERSKYILSGENETSANKSAKFPTHFSFQMNPEQKKKEI